MNNAEHAIVGQMQCHLCHMRWHMRWHIDSILPIVLQHAHLDARPPAPALLTTAAFSAE